MRLGLTKFRICGGGIRYLKPPELCLRKGCKKKAVRPTGYPLCEKHSTSAQMRCHWSEIERWVNRKVDREIKESHKNDPISYCQGRNKNGKSCEFKVYRGNIRFCRKHQKRSGLNCRAIQVSYDNPLYQFTSRGRWC